MNAHTDYEKAVQDLRAEVESFVPSTTDNVTRASSMMSRIKDPRLLYAAVPLGIALLLFLAKPGFVMEEIVQEDGQSRQALSWRKLGIFTVVGTLLGGLGYYVAFVRKTKNSDGE